jgi:hypothetical protein
MCHHITSHHITSHHITSHHITSVSWDNGNTWMWTSVAECTIPIQSLWGRLVHSTWIGLTIRRTQLQHRTILYYTILYYTIFHVDHIPVPLLLQPYIGRVSQNSIKTWCSEWALSKVPYCKTGHLSQHQSVTYSTSQYCIVYMYTSMPARVRRDMSISRHAYLLSILLSYRTVCWLVLVLVLRSPQSQW